METRSSPSVESIDADPPQLQSLDPAELGKRLLKAAKEGDVKEADSLLFCNADIHYKDSSTERVNIKGTEDTWSVWGCTALDWAAMCNKVEMITFLLQRGADIHRPDDSVYQMTALHWASRMGNVESASLLLHNKACIDCLNLGSQTALHHASTNGHAQVVSILLHHNACIDFKGTWTPLHSASMRGHEEVVAVLLRHYADVYHRGGSETVWQVARRFDHVGVMELLKDTNSTTFKWTEECVGKIS